MKPTTLLVVLLLAVIGLVYAQTARAPLPQPVPQPTVSNSGRYQIIFSPHLRADTFLVDTQTGKVWQKTSYAFLQGEPEAWLNVDRIDTPLEEQIFVAAHAKKVP
jgi:hypothetical protein